MPYNYNGKHLAVNHPVVSISVNRNKVIFHDAFGHQSVQLASSGETKHFLDWLVHNNDR